MSDERDKQILADLANHPGWGILRRRTIEYRDSYFAKLGRSLYDNPASVDTLSLAGKSGFFRGMFFLLNQPVFEQKAIERAMAQDEGVDNA